MYFRAPGRPDARHLRLIDISTHVAAIAITRHQRVEALRASEERLRLALSGATSTYGNTIWPRGIFGGMGELKAILGWPGRRWRICRSKLCRGRHSSRGPPERGNRAPGTRSPRAPSHEVEFRVIHPDGSLHWFVSKGRPEFDSRGKAVRLTGVAMEITERKRAEEEIHRREAQLVEAQRIAHLGSYEWDLRTYSVNRSEELCRIFGLLPHEFEPTYEGYLARVHPEDRSTTKEHH